MTVHPSSSAARRTSPTITLHSSRSNPSIQLLEADGGSVRAGIVAKRLGTSVALVEVLRQAGRLLAVQVDHGFLYPVWQFEGRGQLAGLPAVLEALAGLEPWMQLVFFLSAQSELAGRRPLDLLREGEQQTVLFAARRFHSVNAVDRDAKSTEQEHPGTMRRRHQH
jgi:hypothetical protein